MNGPAAPESPSRRLRGLRAVPRSVWTLGVVSMFMDISSEMIHALLPVFLVTVLGTGAAAVGIIEGVARAAASVTKVFSGALSDYLGRRKLLAVIGYALAASTKPLFPLAASASWVFAARLLDRIGKGIRDAPRDAFIGDITPPHLRGASYGLRQGLDTVGAVAGPLAAIGLMALTDDDYRAVFWVAVVPAFLAVALLVVGIEEKRAERSVARLAPMRLGDVGRLGRPFWAVVAFFSAFAVARFSEAFLVLRALDVGLAPGLVPLVLVAMNVVYAVGAYPAGALSDRVNRLGLLAAGLLALVAANLALAFADNLATVFLGVALWGLQMALTQGTFAALVVDSTPAELRGTAFGIINSASGVATLLASTIAGLLWDAWGAPATFLAGAAVTALTAVPAMLVWRQGRSRGRGAE